MLLEIYSLDVFRTPPHKFICFVVYTLPGFMIPTFLTIETSMPLHEYD